MSGALPPGAIEPADGSMRAEVHRLFHLSWPVVLAFLGTVGMGVVDSIMVGRLGAASLAAVALANTWNFAIVIVALGVGRGLDPIVAQAHGAGDTREVASGFALGVALAALLAPVLISFYLIAEPALTFLGQPRDLIPVAADYCGALVWGVPGLMGTMICRQFLQALGKMKPGTVAVLLANVVNAALNWVLIYGHLGMPALGAVGSGYATSVSQWFMLGVLLWLGRRQIGPHWSGWRAPLSWRALGGIAAIGLPIGFQMGLEAWAFHAAGLMMGWLGTLPVAAHSIALNLAVVSFMVPNGLAAAAATRVGHLVGAGLPWQRTARLAVAMGGLVMVVPALAFTLVPGVLAGIYTADPALLALASSLLPMAGAFQLFDGIQVVCFGVLRGVGDIYVPSAANAVGYWLLGLPLGAFLAFRGGWGPRGIWAGFILALAAVAVLLLVRIVAIARRGAARVTIQSS